MATIIAPLSRVYSYKDVAALVLSVLHNANHVSLQRLREVSEKLSHLEDDRWTRTRLYFLRRKVLAPTRTSPTACSKTAAFNLENL